MLVIAVWSVRTTPAVSLYQQQTLMKVALSANNTQQAHAKKNPEKIRRAAKKPSPEKKFARNKPAKTLPARQKTADTTLPVKSVKQPGVVETALAHAPALPPASLTKSILPDRQQLTTRIQKHLKVQIAYHYSYPNIAVRNDWEGQVQLGLRVQANGELTHIHVINSSGYSVLDNAAVKSIRHVAALPEASDWLQGQTIDVILPVIYKLTDS